MAVGVMAGGLPALRPGPEREALPPDGLHLDFGGEAEGGVVQKLDKVAEACRPLDPEIAAHPVEIAADGDQGVEPAKSLDASREASIPCPLTKLDGPSA